MDHPSQAVGTQFSLPTMKVADADDSNADNIANICADANAFS